MEHIIQIQKMKTTKFTFYSDFLFLKYIPEFQRLVLSSELKFVYRSRFETPKFSTDVEPYGEEYLCTVNKLEVSDDFTEIEMEVIYEAGQELEQKLIVKDTSFYEVNKIMHKIVNDVNNHNKSIQINKNNSDKIELSFEKGKFESLEVHKYNANNLTIDHFQIFMENEKLMLRKHGGNLIYLDKFSIEDFKINYSYDSIEYFYTLDISIDVYNIIEILIKSSQT